jgi:formylglycine-generating enzyme required for sulfatase activity
VCSSDLIEFDLVLQAAWEKSWSFSGDKRIGDSMRSFRMLGFAGIIPIWMEAVWEFYIGSEGEVSAQANVTAGFQSSSEVAFGATLRDGAWSPNAISTSRVIPFPVVWQGGGVARVQNYIEPRLSVYLDSLAGPKAKVRPFLELESSACVEPGHAGLDVALYHGISGKLELDVRGWDKNWASLPAWDIFKYRSVKPIWHKSLTTQVSTPPKVFGNMVWITCGTFTMGREQYAPRVQILPPDAITEGEVNDLPQTRVTISDGFWMGKYEVTQREYLAVVGVNPSYNKGNLDFPVERVMWDDAVAFTRAVTMRERNAGRLPAGYEYRLPTEAEWEYACRAGTTTELHYGEKLLAGMANFNAFFEYPPCGIHVFGCKNPAGARDDYRTTPVGSYAPNAWGLHDMHGNVSEWCLDSFSVSLTGGSVTDPLISKESPYRSSRGGSYLNSAYDCLSGMRLFWARSNRESTQGFRLVLAPTLP